MTLSLADQQDTAEAQRIEMLRSIKRAPNVKLPELKYWNYNGCAAHPEPRIDCQFRACGGDFFDHQRVAIAWLYAVESGIIGDVPGAGKTGVAYGLLALLKEKHKLTDRALVVCQTPAVLQWLAEARRWVPKLNVEAVYSGLKKPQRMHRYTTNWDVMVIGYHMLLQDQKWLEKLEPGVLIIDDVDPLLNHENKVHSALSSLAMRADRCVVMNGTIVQTKLQQVHAATVPVGGHNVFGSLDKFESRYVNVERTREYNSKTGKYFTSTKQIGYKNFNEFRSKLAPIFLRRNYDQLTDIRMPEIMPPEIVWLDLHPAQRAKYKELQGEVITLMRQEGTKVQPIVARTRFMYGQQICSGLPALREPDGPQASSKLDWLCHHLVTAWKDRKVVVFIRNIGLVEAFQARLDHIGIGYGTVWGKNRKAEVRQAEIDRFWRDPKCRVFMGTSAIERSLNLQVANIVVNVDTPLNPARVGQIVGRVRRAGSQFDRLFVFTLLTRETQEEGYIDVLRKREALAAHTYNESQELYEELSGLELLKLIRP